MTTQHSDTENVLSLQGIFKQYGTVQALQDVCLECRAGEIHAVVGENGSGKSTLLGVASGFVEQDQGTVHIGGEGLNTDSTRLARELGLGMAYQEVSQVGWLAVKENLYMATPKHKRPSYIRMKRWAIDLLDQFELDDLFADMPVAMLALAERQLLEVVKALLPEPKVLLLDEPTTALGPAGVEWLHRTILEQAARGIGVVYVSHRLPEVLEVADRVTVLRDGQSQGTYEASGMTEAELVELMIGRPFDTAFPQRPEKSGDEGDALSLIALQGKFFGPLSLTVKRGEILGVAGVEGNGQGDFFHTLSGRIPPKRGIVKVGGEHADLTSPIGALHSGIMLLAGDRKNESLFAVLGVRSNATIQVLKRFSRFGFIRRQLERETVTEMAANLKIRTPSLEQPVQFLSGGNQQKVALARTSLRKDISVVLADEPTQGVDASSRLDIYEALNAKAAQGTGIIVKSSDPIELSGLCDRVIVMSRGQIVNELTGDELSERHIIEAIVGGVNISIDVIMPDVGKSIADLTGENAAKESK